MPLEDDDDSDDDSDDGGSMGDPRDRHGRSGTLSLHRDPSRGTVPTVRRLWPCGATEEIGLATKMARDKRRKLARVAKELKADNEKLKLVAQCVGVCSHMQPHAAVSPVPRSPSARLSP